MPASPPNGSEEKTPPLPVYILAGGKSVRYGSDKARATIDGSPLVLRLAGVLAPYAQSVTVVAASPGAYNELGLDTIGDLIKNKGPMGGVLTALEHHGTDGWVFVAACDWVGVRPEWIDLLWRSRSLNAQAVVFRSTRHEPLFALYHTSLCDELRRRIKAAKLCMQEVLDASRTVEVPLPADWKGAANVNTPKDLPD